MTLLQLVHSPDRGRRWTWWAIGVALVGMSAGCGVATLMPPWLGGGPALSDGVATIAMALMGAALLAGLALLGWARAQDLKSWKIWARRQPSIAQNIPDSPE